jgi:hypothetical protein
VKLTLCLFPVFVLLLLSSLSSAQAPASFRVLFGVTDSTSTRWDGTITAKQAGNFTIEGWRLEGVDNLDGNLFHFSTHPARLFNNPTGGSVVANGFIVTADAVTESSEFLITTAQGDFHFSASEIPYGSGVYKLGGHVYVDRVPAAMRLTNTPEEEDYPAVASGANGDVWLAYVQFHHNPDHIKLRSRRQFGMVPLAWTALVSPSSIPGALEKKMKLLPRLPGRSRPVRCSRSFI